MKKPEVDKELMAMSQVLQVLRPLDHNGRAYVLAAAILQMRLIPVEFAHRVIAALGMDHEQ